MTKAKAIATRFNANDAVRATLDALAGPRFESEMERQYENIRSAAEQGERECLFEGYDPQRQTNLFISVKNRLKEDGYSISMPKVYYAEHYGIGGDQREACVIRW